MLQCCVRLSVVIETKMSSTGHIRDWNAVVHQVPWRRVMKAVMYHRHELELHSLRHVEPMKVDMQSCLTKCNQGENKTARSTTTH